MTFQERRGWRRAVAGWREHAAAALVFMVLAIAMTWPLARNLDRAVSDPGDPLINIWILDWDWWATFHQPLSLFHANAFHPAKYSLAFSENLYAVAVLLFPLRALGAGPVTAYNVAVLAGFAFCGVAAYLLGRKLTGSFAAGLAAGVFYAFVPFRFVHLSHVQHIWGGWLPLLLFSLLLYAERPTWKRGVWFAAIFVANGLTNVHYLLFAGVTSGITALLLLPRSAWLRLGVPMAGAALVLAPFLYPYLAVAKLYGMQRSWEEVWTYSAVVRDWLPHTEATELERRLYPGHLAVAACVVAFFVARRERARLALAWLWIAIGFAGSLGVNFIFHEFLFGALPGFRAIRAPARWAVIAYIGIAIVIALVTAAVARRSRWAALIVPGLFVVTLWVAPIRWFLLDPEPPPVYRWLAKQNISAVAELPMDVLSSEYAYMHHAATHHQRFVNGVSGFSPPVRDDLSSLSNSSPMTDAFTEKLQAAGVELVIVHSDWYGERAPALRDWLRRELERGRLRYVAHFDAKLQPDWVFSLRGGRAEWPHELDVYLAGGSACVATINGVLETPTGVSRIAGRAGIAGWASSPDGIASVSVSLNNRALRYPARLTPIQPSRCGGAPPVRFELTFPSRPAAVWRDTDLLVEITDRKGRRRELDHRWITWE